MLTITTWTPRFLSPLRAGLSGEVLSLAKEVYGILSAPPPRSPERERRKKPQFFINSTNKKAKSVTLHIQGLDSSVSPADPQSAGPFKRPFTLNSVDHITS